MDYADIPKLLKRFDFDEKMRICYEYSRKLLTSNGEVDILNHAEEPHPWELETFLLMCIRATPEYDNRFFQKRNLYWLTEIFRSIREAMHPALVAAQGTSNFASKFLCMAGLTQFDVQENIYIKFFRYAYIFNFSNEQVDIKSFFYDKYHAYYEDFVSLSAYLIFLNGSSFRVSSEIVQFLLVELFPAVFNALSISLDNYKAQLNEITVNTMDYICCLRPSYTVPFLVKGTRAYFPLPHLLGRAATSSLLYRLTNNDDVLRKLIGQPVLESYLFKILDESRCYDECYPEQEYCLPHHNKGRTEDVMLRQGEDIVFLDSKSSVPPAKLRILDENTFSTDIEKRAENIVQMYKNLKEYFQQYPSYNPFQAEISKEDKNLWGIVVVLEDSYVRRQYYYEKAAELLGICEDTPEYVWLMEHIKVFTLYDIELYALSGRSVVDGLKAQLEQGTPMDFSLPQRVNGCDAIFTNKSFLNYRDSVLNGFAPLTQVLSDAGIIQE